MRWIVIIGLLLIVSGCTDPVLPPELKAVLDDPAFSEVGEVVHQGSLDGLPGCWGSYYETDDGIETYAEFVEFGEDTWRHVMYGTLYGVGMVSVEEGAYTVEDDTTVSIVIDQIWSSDPDTGDLILKDYLDYPKTRNYEVSLQGDRMTLFVTGLDADQYEGTYWRFAECP